MTDRQSNDIINWVYAALHACRDADLTLCDPIMHTLATLTMVGTDGPLWVDKSIASDFPCQTDRWLSGLFGCVYEWGPFLGTTPEKRQQVIRGTGFRLISAESEQFTQSDYYAKVRPKLDYFLDQLFFYGVEEMSATWACTARIMAGDPNLWDGIKVHLLNYGNHVASAALPLVNAVLPRVGEIFIERLQQYHKPAAAARLALQLGLPVRSGPLSTEGAPVFGLV